jgi:hypothetical protein
LQYQRRISTTIIFKTVIKILLLLPTAYCGWGEGVGSVFIYVHAQQTRSATRETYGSQVDWMPFGVDSSQFVSQPHHPAMGDRRGATGGRQF